MRLPLRVSSVLIVLIGGVQIAGCQSLLPLLAIPVSLFGNLKQIELIAGEQSTECGTVNFVSDSGFTIGRGTIELSPDALSFLAFDANAKGYGVDGFLTAQTMENTIVASVFIAPIDMTDTATEVGEQYGPFTVVLDENLQPTSVSPTSFVLTQNTVDLLNSGSFGLCLQIDSSVSGTFSITTITLNLGF